MGRIPGTCSDAGPWVSAINDADTDKYDSVSSFGMDVKTGKQCDSVSANMLEGAEAGDGTGYGKISGLKDLERGQTAQVVKKVGKLTDEEMSAMMTSMSDSRAALKAALVDSKRNELETLKLQEKGYHSQYDTLKNKLDKIGTDTTNQSQFNDLQNTYKNMNFFKGDGDVARDKALKTAQVQGMPLTDEPLTVPASWKKFE